MVLTAALLFAVNGTVSKVILATGLSAERLTAVRATGALVGLGLVLASTRPGTLRVARGELPFLAFFGVVGVALVQWSYFFAIHRLEIGIALLIQYLAPLLVALWARLVLKEPVRKRVWLALALALTGLSLVVQLWNGGRLDGLGVAASLVAAVAFAVYILSAERAARRRDPLSLSWWGFLFAALFWAVLQPWWSFPEGQVTADASLLGNLAGHALPVWVLAAWVIVFGTIVPFGLVVAALQRLPATRVGILAMLEPVAGTVVAYAWLDETLAGTQVLGGLVVLSGILLAQTAR
jgi:drug/metabolite transporter (DMT)-like permease